MGETPSSIPPEGPRELRSLTTSFNMMSADLERARAAERSFLLSVSHELRTPVAAVQGFAEGIQEGVIDTEKAAAFIVAESRRLERLIGDLLDLARVGAGRFDVRPQELDLHRIAQDAAARCAAAADSLTTRVVVMPAAPCPAYGDPDRVLQLTSNLIENALRLSPPSGVVTVETRPGSVTVADNGPGLSSDDLEHAFDRFFLYDRTRETARSGQDSDWRSCRNSPRRWAAEPERRRPPGSGPPSPCGSRSRPASVRQVHRRRVTRPPTGACRPSRPRDPDAFAQACAADVRRGSAAHTSGPTTEGTTRRVRAGHVAAEIKAPRPAAQRPPQSLLIACQTALATTMAPSFV